jgi:hypothetical protein
MKTIKTISLTLILACSQNAFSTDSDGGNSGQTNDDENNVRVCVITNEASGEQSCMMVKA